MSHDALDRPGVSQAGLDLLRSLAEYPHRTVHLSQHQLKSRIVIIDRDQDGNILRSTERIEESEFTDLDGRWLD